MEALKTIVLALIGGGTGAALVNAIFNGWKFKAERKAKKEDMAAEKKDKVDELTELVEALREQQRSMSGQLDALRDAQKCVLLDRIIYLGQSYIAAGEVDFDDRKRLRDMHNSYHNGLKGNGDADQIMKSVDSLPLKNHSKSKGEVRYA